MDAPTNIAVGAGGLVLRGLLLVALAFTFVALVAAVYHGGRGLRRLGLRMRHLADADRVLARDDVHYAKSHLWLRGTKERLRLGLDDLVRRLVPTPDVVELAAVGVTVQRGQPLARLRTAGRTLDIPSPLTGQVVAQNRELVSRPGLLSRSYTGGWLVEVRPQDEGWKQLPRADAAVRWLREEQVQLSHKVERELGIAGADGGEPLAPWEVALPVSRRLALAKELLAQS